MLAAAYRRHGPLFWQLVRYGITGGLASVVNIAVYAVCVRAPRGDGAGAGVRLLHHWQLTPNQAWALGFAAAVAVGYIVHSRWSFRGHGGKRNLARTGTRFLAVSLVSFALNSVWVWLLVQHFRLPTWAPYPLVLTVTPLAIFSLNRRWVFE